MAASVRNITLGLVLAFAGSAAPTGSPSFALAQGARDGIDLNGFWKMDGGYVWLEQNGSTVKTLSIYSGGDCHGTPRTYVIEGQLSGGISPAAIQSTLSGKLRVCSGSPDLVRRCPSLSSYDAEFTNATVEPNRIAGDRRVQYVEGCTVTGYPDTRSFELTRNACSQQEALLAYEEEQARAAQRNALTSLEVFSAAQSAARARYGDTFTYQGQSWPTNTLQIPYELLTGNFSVSEASGNLAPPEVFLERLQQLALSEPAGNALSVARLMARDLLVEAAAMVGEMNRVIALFPRFEARVEMIRQFRTQLEDCRKANPGGE
jgi:hypothetical protein